jgi:hypothetical protein
VAFSVSRLCFWTDELLLAMDQDSSSVLILREGDLVGTVHSDHVVIQSYYNALDWDRSTNTLLLASYYSNEVAVQRVDSANGWLIQSYELPARLSGSGVQDISVDDDGNMWLLLADQFGPWEFTQVLVLSRAGRLRRELHLSNFGCSYSSLLVAVELDRMFLTCRGFAGQSIVAVHSLDGRSLFNVSGGPDRYGIQDVALGLNPPQLWVLSRQALLRYHPLTGELLGNTTFPLTFIALAITIAPGNGDVFLSQISNYVDDEGRYDSNCSILQVSAQGRRIAEYGGSSVNDLRYMFELVVTDVADHRTLFAVDLTNTAILMWQLQQDEQRANSSSEGNQLQERGSSFWQPLERSRVHVTQPLKAE